ncbi:PucR family transcriptional regulator [Salirhabdus salicampi]|uniref:PucR family transcriptional regulator n=1 Tax=Salirhabdus salicampi TaxID=476102 RepID=UPI0020C402DC|nr:PucR family transcriptional regulator [Salirhabdus salicampi]MCP8615265.1 PucR family transcriptional regulator ligand-binding domain-containing protein [Salirhabdus salicampi]
MDHKNFLQVSQLLELKTFQGSELIAGLSGLSNKVKSTTVAEVPDSADWIAGGEVVFSTGYFFKDDIELQKTWLNSLINNGASALALKPERFLGDIDKSFKEIADRQSFPIIKLPNTVIWPTLIQNVTEKLQEHQYEILRKTGDIHNHLTNLVLSGGNLGDITQTISNLVGNPVIVEDCLLDVLVYKYPDNKSNEKFKGLIDYRISDKYRKKFKKTNPYNKSIKERDNNLFTLEVNVKGQESFNQQVLPIVANNVLYGFLSAIEVHNEISRIDVKALEHGATTIALDMIKTRVTLESTTRTKTSFMNELIQGSLKGDLETYVNKKIIPYNISEPSIIVNINIDSLDDEHFWIDNKNENFFIERYEQKIEKAIELNLDQLGHKKRFVTSQGNMFTIILPLREKNDSSYFREVKDTFDNLLSRLLQEFSNINFTIGISDPYYDLDEIKKSYLEAKQTTDLAKEFLGSNTVSLYKDLGVLKILALIENKNELYRYCNETLGELISNDKSNKDNLCNTLEVYLEKNGNVTEAAKELYVHPNTLNYRIKKINKVLSIDLSQASIRLSLYLALLIKKVLDRTH